MAENLGFLGEKKSDINFKHAVYSRFNELRRQDIFCDVSLLVDGHLYPANKVILAAASPYFLGLFTSDMQEKTFNVIKMEAISSKVIKEVIDYMYTGEIVIQFSYAKELVIAADYLLIPSLKSLAISVILENLALDNCFELREFGIKFSCFEVQEVADEFITKHFEMASLTAGFKELDFGALEKFVSKDDLMVEREDDVLDRVLDWVKYDVSNRVDCLPQLLTSVRLFSLTKFTLQEYLQKETLIKESVACSRILMDGLRMHLFPDIALHFYQKPRNIVQRNDVKVAIIVGGHNARMKPIPRMIAYALPDGAWYRLGTEMPDARTRHCATVCGGSLYILGGTPMWTVQRYIDQSWNTVIKREDSPGVKHSAVVSYEERLFLFGGEKAVKDDEIQIFDTVREYNPKNGEWKILSSMSCPRAAHSAVLVGAFVYVVGGYVEGEVFDTGEVYHILTDKWTAIAAMNNKRCFAAGANLRGQVFIAGGYHTEEWTAYSSCELYDPETDHWDTMISMPIPRAACGVVQVEDDIFLFGGEQDSKPGGKLDSVVCYSGKEDKWKELMKMPAARSCLQTCILNLPRDFLKPLYEDSHANTDDDD